MTQVGTFTPEQSRIVWETVQRLRQSRFFRNGLDKQETEIAPPVFVAFVNQSGETLPPYGVAEVVGVDTVGGFTYLVVDKPTGPTNAVLVNNEFPVADGEFGSGYRHGVVSVLADSGLQAGDSCQADGDDWQIASGPGPFVFLGYDAVLGCGIARIGGGSANVRFIRFQLAEDLESTSALATIFDADGTTIEASATLEDPETIFTGLTNGVRGIGMQDGSRYFILNANCPPEPEE